MVRERGRRRGTVTVLPNVGARCAQVVFGGGGGLSVHNAVLLYINSFLKLGNITCVLCFAYSRAFLVDVSGSEVLLDAREVALLCAVVQRKPIRHAPSISLSSGGRREIKSIQKTSYDYESSEERETFLKGL